MFLLFCLCFRRFRYGIGYHGYHSISNKNLKFNLLSTRLNSEHLVTEPILFSWTKQWYPVAVESFTDKTKPNEIQLLGNNLVLWHNNKDKKWTTFSDVCPHRGDSYLFFVNIFTIY
jgi:hypothetical protein